MGQNLTPNKYVSSTHSTLLSIRVLPTFWKKFHVSNLCSEIVLLENTSPGCLIWPLIYQYMSLCKIDKHQNSTKFVALQENPKGVQRYVLGRLLLSLHCQAYDGVCLYKLVCCSSFAVADSSADGHRNRSLDQRVPCNEGRRTWTATLPLENKINRSNTEGGNERESTKKTRLMKIIKEKKHRVVMQSRMADLKLKDSKKNDPLLRQRS